MILHEHWLAQAKAMPVGMRRRILHLNERRPNLVVGNDVDKWWCYCHACHEGGIVEKSHVLLQDVQMARPDSDVSLPRDITPIHRTEFEVPIARFLAEKNMAFPYLPELHYSGSRNRLMMLVQEKWHGRDLTGRSPQKWMNYNDAEYVGNFGRQTVVVEDLFSMFKVKWALREFHKFNAVCALGTAAKVGMFAAMATAGTGAVDWMFDADPAGDAGAAMCMLRAKPLGVQQRRVRPPDGLDPKDLTCAQIRALILGGAK